MPPQRLHANAQLLHKMYSLCWAKIQSKLSRKIKNINVQELKLLKLSRAGLSFPSACAIALAKKKMNFFYFSFSVCKKLAGGITLINMRCRLILSSGGRSLEGFGCSPIKRVRELGLIRRESVWSLSSGGKFSKQGQTFQYERTNRLCFYSVPIVCNIYLL